jgi:hydroxymethylglutaryl-CoA reductase
MHSLLLATLLSTAVTASDLARRDAASDFSLAAGDLISSYIPSDKWSALTASVGPAASSASVTGDITSVIYSALMATDPPQWFENAIPAEFKEEVSALESAIDDLRPVETVVQVTTTDSNGSTVTTEVSTTVPAPRTVTSVFTTETTDASGNTVTTEGTTVVTTTP